MATYNSKAWDRWMAAALAGDKTTYRMLLEEIRHWLIAYYTHRVEPQVIEDLVQDTLMKLHNKRHTYDPTQPFGPWLSAIARHSWIDYMRKALKYVEMPIDDMELPSEDRCNSAARHDVRKLLSHISPAQAEVIDMVKLQEMTIDEVSQKTGHSASSVKVMVHRGIKKMRSVIEEAANV